MATANQLFNLEKLSCVFEAILLWKPTFSVKHLLKPKYKLNTSDEDKSVFCIPIECTVSVKYLPDFDD